MSDMDSSAVRISALDPVSIRSAALPSQAELIAGWGGSCKPEISIVCNTFNHEKYVEAALRSFLLQKIAKPFEIIVHDDASRDGTARILAAYAAAYPDLIRLICQSENQFSKGLKPTPISLPYARGRYIALCEGDDFWCDNSKLQMQWDVLESEQSLAACAAHAAIVDSDDNILERHSGASTVRIDQFDLLLGQKSQCRTCTLMIRKTSLPVEWPVEALQAYAFDNFLRYLISSKGDILVLPEMLSCYRVHTSGVWSSLPAVEQKTRKLHDLRLLMGLVPEEQRALVECRVAALLIFCRGISLPKRLASMLACFLRPGWSYRLARQAIRAKFGV